MSFRRYEITLPTRHNDGSTVAEENNQTGRLNRRDATIAEVCPNGFLCVHRVSAVDAVDHYTPIPKI
jgi:hypothetical protein